MRCSDLQILHVSRDTLQYTVQLCVHLVFLQTRCRSKQAVVLLSYANVLAEPLRWVYHTSLAAFQLNICSRKSGLLVMTSCWPWWHFNTNDKTFTSCFFHQLVSSSYSSSCRLTVFHWAGFWIQCLTKGHFQFLCSDFPSRFGQPIFCLLAPLL